MTFNEGRLAFADFLNTNIISNPFIFIDFWSVVHFITGFLLMIVLLNTKIKHKNKTFFGILVAWELFEYLNYGLLKNSFFLEDSLPNILWDLIIGIGGGILGFPIWKRIKKLR